jgi:hypothetical protein
MSAAHRRQDLVRALQVFSQVGDLLQLKLRPAPPAASTSSFLTLPLPHFSPLRLLLFQPKHSPATHIHPASQTTDKHTYPTSLCNVAEPAHHVGPSVLLIKQQLVHIFQPLRKQSKKRLSTAPNISRIWRLCNNSALNAACCIQCRLDLFM